MFDIIIPVGPSDVSIITEQLLFTKKNVIGFRRIYLVCYDVINIQNNLSLLQKDDESIVLIDERIFPFHLQEIALYLGRNSRNGWYLQQLLKLYSGIVIASILDHYLVIDSDTFFLKPTTFVNYSNSSCLYNVGTEYHKPYFDHMKRLHYSFERYLPFSGICHHMMFETRLLVIMFDMVELFHMSKDGISTCDVKKPFWQLYLEMIDKKEILFSGASEYEIYLNFLMGINRHKIHIRHLLWKNINHSPHDSKEDLDLDLDYVSCHFYDRH